MPLLENLVEGLSNAAGATDVSGRIEQRKTDRKASAHKQLQANTKMILDEVQDLHEKKAKLHPGTDDQTIGAIDKRLGELQGSFTDLYHPEKNPGALQHLGGFLKSHLGGKKQPQVPTTPAEAKQKFSWAGGPAGTQSDPNPFLVMARQMKESGFTDEQIQKVKEINAGLAPKAADKPLMKPYRVNGVIAYYDANHPENVPPGASAVVAGGAVKPLKYDPSTNEVVDQNSGQRYARGDKEAPPEAAAMFTGAEAVQNTKQKFAERLAQVRGASYGMNRGFQVLDTANGNAPAIATLADIKKNPGRYQPAGPAAKALSQENLFQDIIGTSQLTRDAITNLKQDFPLDMKAKIALAMKADDPHAAIDNLVSSGALGSLSSDQQDFLIATRQLSENAMAMRSILGAGQGSEDVRSAIRATLPSLLSPDRSYATRQLDAFDKTIARLHRGVPRETLPDINPGDLKNKTKTAAGAGTTKAFSVNGTIYDIPADKVAAFRKKYPNAQAQ